MQQLQNIVCHTEHTRSYYSSIASSISREKRYICNCSTYMPLLYRRSQLVASRFATINTYGTYQADLTTLVLYTTLLASHCCGECFFFPSRRVHATTGRIILSVAAFGFDRRFRSTKCMYLSSMRGRCALLEVSGIPSVACGQCDKYNPNVSKSSASAP